MIMASELAETLPDLVKESIPPEQSIGYQIRRLSQEMTAAMDKLVSRHDVSSAQWGYLRHIYYADGLSQRELSDRVGRQGATTVTALKRLEQSGFVETRKSDHDQRKNKVYLTAAGRDLVQQLMPYVEEVADTAFRGFSPDEIDMFWSAVTKIRGNFGDTHHGRWPTDAE
jgi:DNA-binding MarR family transcriptional regulator